MGLFWDNDHWSQRDLYEIGWCGQECFAETDTQHDYAAHRRAVFAEQGLMTLDFWALIAPLPNVSFIPLSFWTANTTVDSRQGRVHDEKT